MNLVSIGMDKLRTLMTSEDILERLFLSIFIIFILFLLVTIVQYDWMTRTFPLVIGIPTLVLLLVLVAIQTSERLSTFAQRFQFSISPDEMESLDEEDGSRRDRRKKAAVFTIWLVYVNSVVYLFGFYIATILFLVPFYRIHTEFSWAKTASITVAMIIALNVAFERAAGIFLYQGIIGEYIYDILPYI
jgi:hypothetical protein